MRASMLVNWLPARKPIWGSIEPILLIVSPVGVAGHPSTE
jgi:hypothetical protein